MKLPRRKKADPQHKKQGRHRGEPKDYTGQGEADRTARVVDKGRRDRKKRGG